MFDIVADLTIHNFGPKAIIPPQISHIWEYGPVYGGNRIANASEVGPNPPSCLRLSSMAEPPS